MARIGRVQRILRSQVGRGAQNSAGLGRGKMGSLSKFAGTARSKPSSLVRRLPNAAGAFHLRMELVVQPFVDEVEKLLAGKSPALVARTLIALMAEILARVRRRTPVDTGMARATWQLAEAQVSGRGSGGSATLKTRGKTQRDSKGRFLKGSGAVSAQPVGSPSRWIEVTRNVYPAVKGSRQRVIVTNRLPYILPLEYGWSGQAPLGMVRMTIAEMRGMAPREIAKLFRAAWLESMLSAARKARPYVKRFGKGGRIREAGVTWRA